MSYSPLTLADIWRAIRSRMPAVLLATLAFGGAAAAYAFLTTPVYRSEVLLSVVDGSKDISSLGSTLGSFGGLASLTGLNLESGNQKAEALAVLRSRFFTEKFIRERGLMPVLFDEKWDSTRNSWKSTEVPTDWDAYRLFDRRVRSVDEDSNTGLVTLAIDWQDREQAAAWANQLIGDLNNHLRKIAISEAENSIKFLNEALAETSIVELRNVIFQLIEKQVRTITLANVREEYAFRVLDPAVAADADEYIWPQKGLIILLGLFSGLLVGITIAMLLFFSGANPRAFAASRE